MDTLWRFKTSLLPIAGIVIELLAERSCDRLDRFPDVCQRVRR